MAGAKSYAACDTVLGLFLRPPATPYLALFNTAPTDSGGGVEVAAGGYARQGVAFGAPEDGGVFAKRKCVATADVTFPKATAPWGNLLGWAIFDAESGGTMGYYEAVSLGTINTNDQAVVRAAVKEEFAKAKVKRENRRKAKKVVKTVLGVASAARWIWHAVK